MQITKISKQKRPGYYNLFIDGRFATGIDEKTLLRLKLKTGDAIDRKTYKEVLSGRKASDSWEYALLLLKYRARSTHEIQTRLKKKGYTSAKTAETIEKLKKANLLDDAKLAYSFAKNKFEQGYGKYKVFKDLLKLGLGKDLIEESIKKASNELKSEDERVNAVLKRRAKSIKTKDRNTFYRRAGSYLARRGFSNEAIHKALKKHFNEEEYEDY